MQEQLTRGQLLWLAMLFEGGLGVVACLLGLFLEPPPWELLTWSGEGLGLGLAVTLPMLAGFFACVRWPVGPLREIKGFSDQIVRPLFRQCTLTDLALICLCAGFGEELLFRGALQTALVDQFGPWLGIVAASALFGLVHPITVTYVVLATLVGLYLGFVFWLDGNLLSVIVAHGVYDFVALVYLVRLQAGPPQESADEPL
jgi:membrane protease YdiL (CAAX protease family)